MLFSICVMCRFDSMVISEEKMGIMTKQISVLLLFTGLLIPTIHAQSFDESTLFKNAQTFLDDKQYDNAINELNKILEEDPDNIQALNEKGNIRLIQGKYVKALQNFEKTLQLQPKNIVA